MPGLRRDPRSGGLVSELTLRRHRVDEPTGDRWRVVARGVGQLFITLGVVILLFVVYELWFTNFYTEKQQRSLGNELRHNWLLPGPDVTQLHVAHVPLGSGLAVLQMPQCLP